MRSLYALLGSCALLVRADYIRTYSYSSTDCGQGGDVPMQTTVTNFACTGNSQIVCTNGTAYIMNSYTAAGCTGSIVNPDFNVVPGNGRCIPDSGPTVTSYRRAACVSGSYNPESRAGVRLNVYSAFLPNETCSVAAKDYTPTSYVDIAPACQRYNTGGGDDNDAGGGMYLSYTISCVNGGVRTVYYKGYNCQGSTDTYTDQICDSTPSNNFLWFCAAPAAAASKTGAIVGGVLGGVAFIAIVAALFAMPGLRANIFRAFSSAKASATAAAAGGSTYEALPLKGTA